MDPLIWQLILQLLLILINAFFASTEIAVVSLNASKLRADAEEGDKRAAKLLRLLEAPTAFLSTIQIAITLAGLLGSAFAATNFSERLTNWLVLDRGFTALPAETLNTLIVILITLVLGYFTLVLGELVPKRIAMQKPMQIARISAPVVSVLSVLMRPVIWLLSISVTAVLRLFGLKNQAKSDIVTEEDIRMMLDESEEEGLIESAEGEMIDNIFEFNNIQIYDVMTHLSTNSGASSSYTAILVEVDPGLITRMRNMLTSQAIRRSGRRGIPTRWHTVWRTAAPSAKS